MSALHAPDSLSGGFADPVFDAQAAFRAIMNALARPALAIPLPLTATAPAPMTAGLATIAATLTDADTPVWLDPALRASDPVARWLAFHTGAPIVTDPADAAFAFTVDAARLPPLHAFVQGTAEYPDRSTTIVIAVENFASTPAETFNGPGFENPRAFAPVPAFPDFAGQLTANRALFPRGVDLLFVADSRIAALPRSTRLLKG
jgi:alpha-D-ribose 1-methylphosphonate 5-triphosphate synthase subunit PhnH